MISLLAKLQKWLREGMLTCDLMFTVPYGILESKFYFDNFFFLNYYLHTYDHQFWSMYFKVGQVALDA